MSNVPENFRESINKDGTVDGHIIETHYQPLERLQLRVGYLAVISDAGGVDAETRIPLDMLREILAKDRTTEILAERASATQAT